MCKKGWKGDVFDVAVAFYKSNSLGLGEDKDGVLLFMSMQKRDYSLMVYGDYAKYAFNDAGREAMTRFFLDDFGENKWYDGFSDYLEFCSKYLDAANNGKPYSENNLPMDSVEIREGILIRIAIILFGSLLITCIIMASLSAKMKVLAGHLEQVENSRRRKNMALFDILKRQYVSD